MKITEKLKQARQYGDSTKTIIKLWIPELISVAILTSLPPLLDSYLIASLRSTATYGALGIIASLLHTMTKLSEAIPVAEMAIIGRHNGAKEYAKCGQDLGDTFWTTTFIGIIQFLLIFFGAIYIYNWLGVSEKIILLGAPYLKLRSIGILLVFILCSFLGFMKGVKNTKIPMLINIIGMGIFVFFDYALVLGRFGFPQLGLVGSAIASIIQYSIMITIAIGYIISNKEYCKYFYKLFFMYFNKYRALRLLNLSWRIMVDKGTLAMGYVWISKLIVPMSKYAIVTFDIVNKLERFAILPAAAFAPIATFLVSNRLGAQDSIGAKANVKKIMFLTFIAVLMTITILCYKSNYLVSFFDPKGKYTNFAAWCLVFATILVIFDFAQLILAGALRGSGDINAVMWIRLLCCTLFLAPLSYLFSYLPLKNEVIKFSLIYGTFYINTGLMGLLFLRRIMSSKWHKKI